MPEGMAWGYSDLVPSVDDPVTGTGERNNRRRAAKPPLQ